MLIRMGKVIQRAASVACLAAFTLLTARAAQETESLPEDAGVITANAETSPEDIETASADAQTVEAEETNQTPSEEESMPSGIVVDFPFPATQDEVYEDAVLTLVCVDESAGTYELRLYDKDKNIVLQIPCGELTENISFFYSDLTLDGYEDLEISSSDSQSMLLFASDTTAIETGKLFQDEAVEIPITEPYSRIVVPGEDEVCRTETVYERNPEKNNLTVRGSLKLQKEDGTLEIWDYLENKNIFEGKVALQEDGSPVNEEYYQYLCWGNMNIYRLWEGSEDSTIRVWVSETEKEGENREENGFEWAQKTVFGNTGYMEEYEDRQTFLTDFGFADKEPFYQYYDNRGNLQLELYLDEESGKGCGLIYDYYYTYQLEKRKSAYGFAFDAVYQGEWEAADPYILTTVGGSTGEDEGREYEDITEYTEDGKIDYYKSMAFVDWIGPDVKEEKDTLLEINYIYRDDGTLYYRNYHHNSMVFETTFCGIDSFYDELGRVVYESGYITHGSIEEYYIYDDGGKEPKYYLLLDDNLGYCIPTLVRFH